MKQRYRQAIFIIFLVFFVISIPLLLVYTAGYRYNIKKNKIEKTGTLLVSLKTKNAALCLNNKNYQIKDVLRIKNLLPDDYSIKISKNGYFDWQKKLAIESELTTFIKDVRLIKNGSPESVLAITAKTIYPSSDKNKFAYFYYDKKNAAYLIDVFDAADGTAENIGKSTRLPLSIKWSPDDNKFFAQTDAGFKIFDLEDGETDSSFLKNKIYDLKWDEKNGLILFARLTDGIYKTDLLFNSPSRIYSSALVDSFHVSQDYLYTIERNTLKQFGLSDGKTVSIPLERKDYAIESVIDKKIFLLGKTGKMQIFKLPLEKSSAPLLLANAIGFDVSGDDLLYNDDFELWNYKFSTGSKELITRLGTEIKKALWANSTGYILFVSDNQVKMIELDKRDERQVFTIADPTDISDITLAKGSTTAYFTGRVLDVPGLYKLEI